MHDNAVAGIASLSSTLGLDPHTMRLHREDPKTTHACPGTNVRKLAVIQDIVDEMARRDGGDHPPAASV